MISVIILYYNDRIYITEAIDSILKQNVPPKQIIIVDNGSTDGGLEAFESNPQIQIIKLDCNLTIGAARNLGLGRVESEFVGFLDSDDIWEEDKIQKLLPFLEKKSTHYLHSNFVRIDSGGNILEQGPLSGLEGFCADEHFKLGSTSIGPPSTVIARVSSIKEIGGFDNCLSLSSDWDLNQRMARNFPIVHSKEYLVKYRVHSNNMSKNIDLYFQEMSAAIFKNYKLFGVKKSEYRFAKSRLNLIMAGEFWNKRRLIFLKYLLMSVVIDPKVIIQRIYK